MTKKLWVLRLARKNYIDPKLAFTIFNPPSIVYRSDNPGSLVDAITSGFKVGLFVVINQSKS